MAWLIIPSKGSIQIRWYDAKGNRHSASTGTHDRRKAERLRIKKELELEEIKCHPEKIAPISLKELFIKRQQHLEHYNYSPGTIRREKLIHNNFTTFIGEQTRNTPSLKDFEDYKNHRFNDGLTIGGMNVELRHLQATFNWGASQIPPLSTRIKIPLIKEDIIASIPPFLEEEEVIALFDAIANAPIRHFNFDRSCSDTFIRDYWHMMFRFFLETGARRQEVVDLQWEDVNLTRCTVVFRRTKSRKSRAVDISHRLADQLKSYRNKSTGKVFLHNASGIYYALKYFTLKAGIIAREKCHPHTLRHTFATHHAINGTDPMTLKELMGHHSIETTNRYFHLAKAHRKSVVNNLPWVR